MDVTLYNGIERCPRQCVSADIKSCNMLRYGLRKASATGLDVFIACSHAGVCKLLSKQMEEKGQ